MPPEQLGKGSDMARRSKPQSTAQKKTVGRVMHEFKHGELKSGGKKKVTNRKQAIAIALSEARKSGAKIPKKPAKKGAAKKRSSKK